jgi:NAD(P)-dependent dehydrogenase (short-subunit alcohol dehydrogenase family)
MTDSKDLALITGATRGLGLVAARRLAEQGFTVLLGARDLDRGKQAADTMADGLDVRPIALDVTDDASVAAAAATVEREHGRLDVLVNNAGITGPLVSVEETGPEELRETYETNVIAPVRVTRAFLPLLRRAEHPRVVMVSSGLGSFAITSDPDRVESTVHSLTYTSSKAALAMIGTQYARAVPELLVTVVDPGYTATDLNGHSGPQTVEEGTDAMVAAALDTTGPSGRFLDRHGVVPW